MADTSVIFHGRSAPVEIKAVDNGDGTYSFSTSGAGMVDSDGATLPPDFASLPKTYGYTVDDLTTITVTDGVDTWVKTLGYTDGDLTSESAWVKE